MCFSKENTKFYKNADDGRSSLAGSFLEGAEQRRLAKPPAQKRSRSALKADSREGQPDPNPRQQDRSEAITAARRFRAELSNKGKAICPPSVRHPRSSVPAARPGVSRRQRPRHPRGQAGVTAGARPPDSPVLAVLSIPASTPPPSPPLRLLCAEAAFRGLVLQGGERAREGRLTAAQQQQ